MENFNKNWLVILLVAVIFGTLGFLVGRTTDHHLPIPQRMMWNNEGGADKFDILVDVDDDDEAVVKIDTIMKDGKQIIIKEVKKIKKK